MPIAARSPADALLERVHTDDGQFLFPSLAAKRESVLIVIHPSRNPAASWITITGIMPGQDSSGQHNLLAYLNGWLLAYIEEVAAAAAKDKASLIPGLAQWALSQVMPCYDQLLNTAVDLSSGMHCLIDYCRAVELIAQIVVEPRRENDVLRITQDSAGLNNRNSTTPHCIGKPRKFHYEARPYPAASTAATPEEIANIFRCSTMGLSEILADAVAALRHMIEEQGVEPEVLEDYMASGAH